MNGFCVVLEVVSRLLKHAKLVWLFIAVEIGVIAVDDVAAHVVLSHGVGDCVKLSNIVILLFLVFHLCKFVLAKTLVLQGLQAVLPLALSKIIVGSTSFVAKFLRLYVTIHIGAEEVLGRLIRWLGLVIEVLELIGEAASKR